MPEHSEELEVVFVSVLERLAYMFAEPVTKEEMPSEVSGLIQVNIDFSGHTHGKLTLVATENICSELMVNMLGSDPDDELDGQLLHDAIKELLNVMCGRLLTEIAGHDPIFDLSSPEVNEVDSQEWTTLLNESDAVRFLVDDIPVLLRFSMAA